METRYICKNFGDTTPLRFSEIINISRPIKRMSLEALANVDSTVQQVVFNSDTKQAEFVALTEMHNPLPIKFCLLESNITPENHCATLFIGGDFESTSNYKYIFQTPREFSGEYNFRIVEPMEYDVANPTKNDYRQVNAPKDNTYVAIKIEFYYE
jgi:hypothetical protein